jgi:hypothetical protein
MTNSKYFHGIAAAFKPSCPYLKYNCIALNLILYVCVRPGLEKIGNQDLLIIEHSGTTGAGAG